MSNFIKRYQQQRRSFAETLNIIFLPVSFIDFINGVRKPKKSSIIETPQNLGRKP